MPATEEEGLTLVIPQLNEYDAYGMKYPVGQFDHSHWAKKQTSVSPFLQFVSTASHLIAVHYWEVWLCLFYNPHEGAEASSEVSPESEFLSLFHPWKYFPIVSRKPSGPLEIPGWPFLWAITPTALPKPCGKRRSQLSQPPYFRCVKFSRWKA